MLPQILPGCLSGSARSEDHDPVPNPLSLVQLDQLDGPRRMINQFSLFDLFRNRGLQIRVTNLKTFNIYILFNMY